MHWADNLIAICEPPRTACYRDTFIFLFASYNFYILNMEAICLSELHGFTIHKSVLHFATLHARLGDYKHPNFT
jgi:hypothetical protein